MTQIFDRFVEVVVDAPTDRPGDLFTYSLPDGMHVHPGQMVLVPFGKRQLRALVVRGMEAPNVDYTRDVLELLSPDSLVSYEQLSLASWVSWYYRCRLFEAITPMLPPGYRRRPNPVIRTTPSSTVPQTIGLGPRRVLSRLQRSRNGLQITSLTRELGPWVPNAIQALLEAGLAELVPLESRGLGAPLTKFLVGNSIQAIQDFVQNPSNMRNPRLRSLSLRLLQGSLSLSKARTEFGPHAVRKLIEMGLTDVVTKNPYVHSEPRNPSLAVLPTADQAKAINAIGRAIFDPTITPRTFLLEGVTGSGKTEVYLQALARCLELNKQALVLVPELSLTPQTFERFESRFPGKVGLLHSGLSSARQREEWWKAERGYHDVIVGSRGAIFAPLKNLGLIILDEEHEWTYKQTDATPRYHARTVANQIARLSGAVVVLGSATPDIESAYRARTGTYHLLKLSNRIQRSGAFAPLAVTKIVDMRDELRSGNTSIFSRALSQAIERALDRKSQAILFLNRRGTASIVECRSCGHVMACSRCAMPMTFHGPQRVGSQPNIGPRLVCHYCNRRRGVPTNCPTCRSIQIRYLGIGTERVASEVEKLWPQATVMRWDHDAAPTPQAHHHLLTRFSSGDADILVGTQMIAKGLDIPTVSVVGLVLADVGLHVPDFRAAERAFQLLTQVAGRAGRGEIPGEAIIQTYNPLHYGILAGASQDFEKFYSDEIGHRRYQAHPPLTNIVRLTVGNSNPELAQKEAERMSNRIRLSIKQWGINGTVVIGPAPSIPERLRGSWRWHLTIRGPDPRIALDKIPIPPAWTVDVDPIGPG